MAGHGDLLDATWETAESRAIPLRRLDGIEVDALTASVCRERLSMISKRSAAPSCRILTGSAFELHDVGQLPLGSYDLVITNPPYVRYQVRQGRGGDELSVRAGLQAIATQRAPSLELTLWRRIIAGYSGLADLSIPSWLLAGLLVRPGGRLALVVPATWRSRNYGDVIRYMLLRCFAAEYIVEDVRAGWFSEALVRTHLIVAKRLSPEETAIPVTERRFFPQCRWIQVAPEAGTPDSVVGGLFWGEKPEADFLNWLQGEARGKLQGITLDDFCLQDEWSLLRSRLSEKRWFRTIEPSNPTLPIFGHTVRKPSPSLPDAVRRLVAEDGGGLCTLEDLGIHVGQGLRTGCNPFFYVTERSHSHDGLVLVQTSESFGGRLFEVPKEALRPVLHRQSDIPTLLDGNLPPIRVLDLRGWALPEDAEVVSSNSSAYLAAGEEVPQTMPSELADLVRLAAQSSLRGQSGWIRIPDMSAVRTNIRPPRKGSTPRFWYMLSSFAPRHLPSAFVPRVNHKRPWVEVNLDPPVLVDANFSSFWSTRSLWTGIALKALLNSVWCQTLMEALGTPLGGGALKLEATHLRRMPVPWLSDESIEVLEMAGKQLTRDSIETQREVDEVVLRVVLGASGQDGDSREVALKLRKMSRDLELKRQRATK